MAVLLIFNSLADSANFVTLDIRFKNDRCLPAWKNFYGYRNVLFLFFSNNFTVFSIHKNLPQTSAKENCRIGTRSTIILVIPNNQEQEILSHSQASGSISAISKGFYLVDDLACFSMLGILSVYLISVTRGISKQITANSEISQIY